MTSNIATNISTNISDPYALIVFVLGAIFMLALSLYFVLPALLSKSSRPVDVQLTTSAPREALNLALLRDQLSELDADLASGAIAAAGYRGARLDLERRVAEEVQGAAALVSDTTSAAQRWPAALLALAMAGGALLLYAMLGRPDGLQAQVVVAIPAVIESAAPAVGPQQIAAMVERLAARLKAQPDDANGWRMLARSYETQQRFALAVDAYAHLEQLEPGNADVLVDHAVALGMTLNQTLAGAPERLIARALAIDPGHVQALALTGSAAFERQDYANAILPWEKILALVPPDSTMGRSIADSIAKARARLAK